MQALRLLVLITKTVWDECPSLSVDDTYCFRQTSEPKTESV